MDQGRSWKFLEQNIVSKFSTRLKTHSDHCWLLVSVQAPHHSETKWCPCFENVTQYNYTKHLGEKKLFPIKKTASKDLSGLVVTQTYLT